MVGQLSRPSNPGAVTKRIWQLVFRRSDLTRKVDEFTYDAAAPVAETKELASIESPTSDRSEAGAGAEARAVAARRGSLRTEFHVSDFPGRGPRGHCP